MTAETEIEPAILPGRRRQPWTRKSKLLLWGAGGAFALSLIFIPQFMGPAEKKEKATDYAPRTTTAPFRMADEPKQEAWPEPKPDLGFHMPDNLQTTPAATGGGTSDSDVRDQIHGLWGGSQHFY